MKGVRRVLVSMFVTGAIIAAYVLPAMADGGAG
jgi:hypothetical protein